MAWNSGYIYSIIYINNWRDACWNNVLVFDRSICEGNSWWSRDFGTLCR